MDWEVEYTDEFEQREGRLMARKFAELRDKMPPAARAKAHELAQAMLAQMEQAPRQKEGKGASGKAKAEMQPARVD